MNTHKTYNQVRGLMCFVVLIMVLIMNSGVAFAAEIGVSITPISRSNNTVLLSIVLAIAVILLGYFSRLLLSRLWGKTGENEEKDSPKEPDRVFDVRSQRQDDEVEFQRNLHSISLVQKHELDDSDVESYLKSDELEVIRILKVKEGSCEQGTIVTISGMSKAKVSAVLDEMEKRHVIYRKKSGKKNIVFIKA